MKKEDKDAWVVALRSGKYVQGHGLLRDEYNRFCCLGVLADITSGDWVNRDFQEFGAVELLRNGYCGLPAIQQNTLSHRNDSGDTFTQIADWIENNVEVTP